MDIPRQPHMQKLRQSDMPIASTYSQTLRSETSAYKSTVHQTSSSSAPSMDDQDEIGENYEMTLLSEAEIINRDGNFLRTQTMTTKDVYKLNKGEMIVVPFNDLNQPIKSAVRLFTRFMTLLVKEPKLCPLDAKNWNRMYQKDNCGVLNLIMELRGDLTFLEQLSAHGKKARGSQVHIHTTGAMSLARKKDVYKVKYKREPDDIEIFEMEHVTKLGSYVDDRSRVLAVLKAKAGFANKLFEVGISKRDDPEKRLEIAREVMQELRPPKKNGRPCGYGVGVTKSQVTKFSFDLRRMRRQGVSSENRFLLNKVAEQSKQIEKQSRKINTMEENMTRFIGTSSLIALLSPCLSSINFACLASKRKDARVSNSLTSPSSLEYFLFTYLYDNGYLYNWLVPYRSLVAWLIFLRPYHGGSE
ncbi:ribose 5-phosphate isomerase A [Tanacetum coccineum]